jgi:hypothetical protein
MFLPGRCLELLLTKPMPRGRGHHLTPSGERAFKLAAREVVGGSGSRGKATPRRGKGGSLSGGRGSGSAAHVEDNVGTEGKTIPIEVEDDMLLGEIDSTYLKYHKMLLKRHPQQSMIILFTLSTQTMMEQVF